MLVSHIHYYTLNTKRVQVRFITTNAGDESKEYFISFKRQQEMTAGMLFWMNTEAQVTGQTRISDNSVTDGQ